jgi:hypothetical protein
VSGGALWLQLPQYGRKPVVAKRKYIPSRSAATRVRMAAYNREVKLWLALPQNRWCLVMILLRRPLQRATQCHHIRGRGRGGRGPLLMDKRGWRPVCFEGHRWIEDNPEQAIALGLLCERGKRGVPFDD